MNTAPVWRDQFAVRFASSGQSLCRFSRCDCPHPFISSYYCRICSDINLRLQYLPYGSSIYVSRLGLMSPVLASAMQRLVVHLYYAMQTIQQVASRLNLICCVSAKLQVKLKSVGICRNRISQVACIGLFC